MTPELTAASAAWPLYELDAAWSTDPHTLRRARCWSCPAGRSTWPAGAGCSVTTRAPDTVAAALGVIAPDAVRAGWEAARKVGPARGRRGPAGRVRPLG